MRGEILLDTNAVIALFDDDQDVRERFVAADSVYVSIVVAGELYFGARKSNRADENVARVDSFLGRVTVPPCDVRTAALFGIIKRQLQTAGRPLPDNDVWVAASARQLDATLVTRDQHFAAVQDLTWESW